MNARRIAAFLIMLLTMHLDIARAYAACAREDTHRAASLQQTGHDHASAATTPAPQHHNQAPSPIPSECCRAMASCVTSLAFNDAVPSTLPKLEHHVIAARIARAPASHSFAPDPPPPRA